MPKVYAHFVKSSIKPNMFAAQWFMTLFTVGFPIELTVRIYDCFFAEGEKILYRIGLYLIKKNEKLYQTCDVDEFFTTMKSSPHSIENIDKFMDNTIKVKITTEQIRKYTSEYKESPIKDVMDACY